MSFATRMQGLVERLTATDKLGNSATFSHPTSTYNRDTGKTTTSSTATLATTIGGPIGVDPRLVNGNTIQERDQTIYVEASQFTFTIVPGTTTVTINSKVFVITDVTPYRVNNEDVAYELVIR